MRVLLDGKELVLAVGERYDLDSGHHIVWILDMGESEKGDK